MAKDTRKFKKAAGTHLNTAGGTMTGDLVFGDDKKLTFIIIYLFKINYF